MCFTSPWSILFLSAISVVPSEGALQNTALFYWNFDEELSTTYETGGTAIMDYFENGSTTEPKTSFGNTSNDSGVGDYRRHPSGRIDCSAN